MKKRPLFAILYVLLWQISFYFGVNRWLTLSASLFVLLLLRHGDFRIEKNVTLSFIISIALIVMLIEPGLAYNKLVYSGLASPLWEVIIYSVLFSISLVIITESVIVKTFYKTPFIAIGLSVLAYIFSTFPITLFTNLNSLPNLLLFNLSFFVILSYYLGFLYLKGNMNALVPVVFLSVFTFFTYLNVSVFVSKLFNIVWEVISISVILFITDLSMKENIKIRRLFRTKKKKESSKGYAPAIFSGFIFMFLVLVALPLITHESHYVIADPTGSMYPIIKPDSLLFVSYIKISEITKGTIIVFHAPWSNGALFAHQVIGIKYQNGTEYFITKGVANAAKDPLPVPASDVVGKVALAIPYLGYLLIYGEFFVVLILAVVAILFALEVRK